MYILKGVEPMYKTLIAVLILACMVGCGAQPTGSQSTPSSSMTQSEAAFSSQTVENSRAEPTPSPVAASSTDNSTSAGSQPTQTPAPDATAEPPENTEQNNETGGSDAATTAYGAVPFEYAAGTDKWWYIDSSDTAYWAVQENINAIRAEAGLSALTMDESLSEAASARCESFVAGGPFDHSGMTTRSEICAKGPLRSASEVCEAWKGSADHYANIVNPDFTTMGVSCWFCDTAEGQYTYWTVTFG